jgi:5-formyltetrahydrofolate cyclo-ligase
MGVETRVQASRELTEKFWRRFIADRAALTVALYAPMVDEPDLKPLHARLERGGHRVVLPEEITGGALRFGDVPVGEIDVMVVPGRAFGEHGERIGRGRGCYDRTLAGLPRGGRPVRVALAFDVQLFPALPQEPWDQRVDWIVTEKREIKATS